MPDARVLWRCLCFGSKVHTPVAFLSALTWCETGYTDEFVILAEPAAERVNEATTY